MNTNSNTYTVIYTAIVVVIVAAVLAFVSQKLGPMQAANEKAETISQILTAAQFGDKESWQEMGNAKTINFYKENINKVLIVDENGATVDSLDITKAPVYSVSELKAQNYNIKGGKTCALVAYVFNNGVTVLPVYGAGLWGPVWGYIALDESLQNIVGAYFDHESETPGLGGKIKDDPAFREQFASKTVAFAEEEPIAILKGGVPEGQTNAVDAITGATMTSKGLNTAINTWLKAYSNFVSNGKEE